MKTTVLSYSMTGNNEALAAAVASALSAEHLRITEPKKRTFGTIARDMMLNLTPKVSVDLEKVDPEGLVIFAGPVWMGKLPSPLRSSFKELKGKLNSYVFVSVSGGALGPNPKLEKELTKRLGRKPEAVIDQQIVSLMDNPNPTSEETSSYQVTEEDIQKLASRAVDAIQTTGKA